MEPKISNIFKSLFEKLDVLDKRSEKIEKLIASLTIGKSEHDLVKIKEAAEIINQKVSYVYHLVKVNAIPFYKVNRSLRFSRSEIQIWMRAGRPKIQQEAIEEMTASYILSESKETT